MLSDFSLWEELKKNILPLKHTKPSDKIKIDLPPKLRVRRTDPIDIPYTLDLHGLTIEEAYQLVKKFITLHQKKNSKKIMIITGKGLRQTGGIKKEMPLWLETPFFQEKIREFKWKNDGGAVDIILKRIKK